MAKNILADKILIIDFGAQNTQLIARRVRELGVYCEIYNHRASLKSIKDFNAKGIILSGGPETVEQKGSPKIPDKVFDLGIPLLGICYGMQSIAKQLKGKVELADKREFGHADLLLKNKGSGLFKGINNNKISVWMSHGDTIVELPEDSKLIASTESVKNAAYSLNEKKVFGLQFHPEVFHTDNGLKIFENFFLHILKFNQDWTPKSFIQDSIKEIKTTVKNDKVILGISGGVDSTVAAVLLNKAIGDNLNCVFVNNGLLRKDEFKEVLAQYENMGLNVVGVDSSKEFISGLRGITDPEQKRKVIGSIFIDVFENQSKKIQDAKWLAQGTIYPDVIESISVKGPSSTIKSHHNVGGIPDKMNLQIIEPLKMLFKDELSLIHI